MTLCIAWYLQTDKGKKLILATDSLITGGFAYPHGTKLLTFNNRKGCALCWEGDTSFTYSFTENARVDVEFSDRLAKPKAPLFAVKERILKVFNQLWKANLSDSNSAFQEPNFSFLIGGYCPLYEKLQLWHIHINEDQTKFIDGKRSKSTKPYIIGSGASVAKQIFKDNPDISPYQVLRQVIEDEAVYDVGGMPQMVVINEKGAVELIGFIRNNQRYLFGRPLNSTGHHSKIRYVPYKQNEF